MDKVVVIYRPVSTKFLAGEVFGLFQSEQEAYEWVEIKKSVQGWNGRFYIRVMQEPDGIPGK